MTHQADLDDDQELFKLCRLFGQLTTNEFYKPKQGAKIDNRIIKDLLKEQ